MMRANAKTRLGPAWVPASAALPCPICDGERGCRLHAEEPLVLCMDVSSSSPLGDGYLHRDEPLARKPSPHLDQPAQTAARVLTLIQGGKR